MYLFFDVRRSRSAQTTIGSEIKAGGVWAPPGVHLCRFLLQWKRWRRKRTKKNNGTDQSNHIDAFWPTRLNSPACCSCSARGCCSGWLQLWGLQALLGLVWRADWMTGPSSVERTPARRNNPPPERTAETENRKWATTVDLNWWWRDSGVPGCVTGGAHWACADQRRSWQAPSWAGFCSGTDEWFGWTNRVVPADTNTPEHAHKSNSVTWRHAKLG